MPSSIGQVSAPLAPLSLVGPGFLGMNTQLSSTTLGPEWAITARNCIFDTANRLASRFGWSAVTGSALGSTPDISVIFEYLNASGTPNIISCAANNKLYSGTGTLTDITGAVTVTAPHFKFVNFNGNCYALQASHALLQYTGAGNFTNVAAASGTVPDGNELLSAFGRLWGSDSTGQKLKYSGLLDATNWGGAGAGSFDFTNVWPTNDRIVALAAFNNYLIIFGSTNILIMSDGTGSVLGNNPTNMTVIDAIHGVGCVARDTVQNVDGVDLVFLSGTGLRSIQRTLISRSVPMKELSANIRDYLVSYIAGETVAAIRSTFNKYYGFYLLILPAGGKIFAFDTKMDVPTLTDTNTAGASGAMRVTEWDNFIPAGLVTTSGNIMYGGKLGKIFQYTGNQDNGSSYNFLYTSGWLTLGDEVRDRLKLLKRLAAISVISGTATVTFQWFFDFDSTPNTAQTTITAPAGTSEWGSAEWGLGEWGTTAALVGYEVPTTGSGQFIQVSTQVPINGTPYALQKLQLFAKIARLK